MVSGRVGQWMAVHHTKFIFMVMVSVGEWDNFVNSKMISVTLHPQ